MGKSKKQKAFIKERDQAIKIHRFSKMIQVNDDWYPCYPHHQVSAHCGIFCGSMDPDTKDWSVFCVISGADDTCVEKTRQGFNKRTGQLKNMNNIKNLSIRFQKLPINDGF